MMRARKREKSAGNYYGARGYRTSFLNGFILGLDERFRRERAEQIRAAEARGTSNALVRVDSAREAVREWMKENIKGSAAKSVRLTANNRGGLEAGRKAAAEVNLNRPVGDGKVAGYIG
jgi:hypothetical protein